MKPLARWRYRSAMLAAIDRAAGRYPRSPYVHPCTRSRGLAVIRDFERVNRITFDPFDLCHVSAVDNMARFRACLSIAPR